MLRQRSGPRLSGRNWERYEKANEAEQELLRTYFKGWKGDRD